MNIYLSVGDGLTGDALDLMDASGILTTSVDLEPWDEDADERALTLALNVKGSDADTVMGRLGAIETKLNQARQAAGRRGGTWVTLGIQPEGATYMTYADVLRGQLRWNRMTPALGNVPATLTLACLPGLRGDMVTVAQSGTITNTAGTAATAGGAGQGGIYIPDVQSELPAPLMVTMVDVSTNSRVINRVRASVHARDDLANAAFQPWLDQTSNAPGSDTTTDTNRVGANYSRITTSDNWQDIANIASGTALPANRGEFDLWVRGRSSADMGTPTGLAATLANGSFDVGVDFSIKVSSIDSGGAESAASDVLVKRSGGSTTNGFALTWTPTGASIANHRVYYMGGTITAWRYQTTGSAAGTAQLLAVAGTNGTPPTVSGAAQPYLRALYGLSSMQRTYDAPAIQMTGGSAWHGTYLGRYIDPPYALGEGLTDMPSTYTVQGVSATVEYTPTLDIDAAVKHAPWPQMVCEWPGLALGTKREWVFGTRRDGRSGCLIRSTADQSEQGQADVIGDLYLLPGDNVLTLQADVLNGQWDITNTAYRLTVSYYPMFRGLRGA